MLASKRKRYLSGSDWVISTLDRAMKASTCAGNMSQIVLVLGSRVNEEAVRNSLDLFVRRFPVIAGTVHRDFMLAPYWSIPETMDRGVDFSVSRMDSGLVPLPPELERSANTPFQHTNEHLAFRLIQDAARSMLVMTFDHRIFDARGAEMFLDLFQQHLNEGTDSRHGNIVFTSSAALTQWSRKFLAGRTVNRRIIALSRSKPLVLPPPEGGSGRFRYRVISFDEQQTSGLYERAYSEAGYLLESPFLLAMIIQTMHELLREKQPGGDSYLIPVTMDLRQGQDAVQEVFFNHVSYLFYQIPLGEAEDRKGLIALLKQQMYDQVKSGFPRDLAEASLLTRIAPLPLLGKLLRLPLKGRMATFAFSHLGKSAYRQSAFMGNEIENLFHMPRVPVPPGIGFFSNYFKGRLNLVFAYLDGMLTDAEAAMIEQGLRKRFSAERSE